MITADLFGINPAIENEKPVIKVTYSRAARWTPDVLLKADLDIHVWLKFLDDCMCSFGHPDHVFTDGFFTIEKKESVVKLIGNNTHSFTIPFTKFQSFIENEIEKLYVCGFISLEKA